MFEHNHRISYDPPE